MRIGQKDFSFNESTYLMGVLNITPDSFSDGGDYFNLQKAVHRALEMQKEGASIIDVGGESTRPYGSVKISAEEELNRVIPVIQELKKYLDIPISVDTYKASVAKKALDSGASMVNDVWGFQRDPDMAKVVADYQVPVILMHNKVEMHYDGDILQEIKDFLKKSIDIALSAGVKKENIITDPGIGFGKLKDHNIQVMKRLSELRDLGFPVLLGSSRKKWIGEVTQAEPKERLGGTLAAHAVGLLSGVNILRVHDIKEHMQLIQVVNTLKS